MAIKFSQFNERTESTPTLTLVGYDGNQNIRILAEDLFENPFISGTENTIAMFGTGGTVLADSILSQDAGATLLTVGGGLNVDAAATFDTSIEVTGDSTLNGNVNLGNGSADLITQYGTLYLNGPVKDKDNAFGAADQILVSNASSELRYIDLADIAAGAAEVVEVPVKNLQGSALTKGDPVYISGSVGTSGRLEVQLADASNAAKMPALGLLKQDLAINEEGFAVVTGKLRNLITSPIDGQTPLANDVIYVKAGGTTGAALTLTKPTGSNLIQNMGKVGRVSTSNDGTFVVSSILRTNDIPNLTSGKIWVGSTGNTIESSSITFTEATGAVQLDEYGIGTHTGTVAKNLAVDANGNVIETSGDIIDGSGTLNYLSKWTPDGNSLGNSLIYDNGTNVGIGDTSPSEKFTLRTAADGSGNEGIFIKDPFAGISRIVASKDPFLSLGVANESSATSTIYMGRNATATDQESKIEWSNANSGLSIYVKGQGSYREHARFGNISSSIPRTYFNGNVGIGTTSPSRALEINTTGSTDYQFRIGTATYYYDIGRNTSNGFLNFYGNQSSDSGFVFETADGERMRIGYNGNVGIGTPSPSQKLEVVGNIQATGTRSISAQYDSNNYIRLESNSSGGILKGLDGGVTTTLVRSYGDSYFNGGNFGIGTTSPTAKLDVDGGVRIADDASTASATNVGTLRYRTSGNNSYVDMCMQTGVSTYAWINIVQNNW